jgi:hypothetical protein
MEAIVRVLLALAACCDWVTMEILDPRGGYLSVPRLAELADLPLTLVEPKEDGGRSRKRHDRTERALRAVRAAEVIAFTQQHREKLEDGRFVSTSPALRKLAVGLFRKFGGHVLRLFEARRKKLKRRRDAESPTTGDLRVASKLRELGREIGAPAPPSSSDASGLTFRGAVPPELLEQIHEEHPDWQMGAIFLEARRRMERAPPTGPPSS